MLIQISSISYISEAPPDKLSFPEWLLIPTAFGLYVMTINMLIGFLIMIIGFAWILIWYLINKARQEKRILTLAVNSNERLLFQFNNIKDNKISGDFQAFNNAKM